MNKVDFITKSKLNVIYIDLAADDDTEEMIVSLDELFLTLLSTNSMGFYGEYQTEYIINETIEANPNIINFISDEYKINLAKVWDYKIIDVLDENNESVKDSFTEEFYKKSLRIDTENQFKILNRLNKELANKNGDLFEIATIYLMGIASHNEVYSTLKTEIQKIILNIVNEI